MREILWISGIEVEKEEMEEIKKTIHRINRKRKAENREKLDYVCTIGENHCISRKLANR